MYNNVDWSFQVMYNGTAEYWPRPRITKPPTGFCLFKTRMFSVIRVLVLFLKTNFLR